MSLVAINRINIFANRRPLNDQKVLQLMQSIKANGLLNPITLDQNLNLVAGLHRLTACKLLGFEQIECKVIACEDRDRARLAEIDENLIRNELEALERSELWLERDQILERLGLRAKSGDNQFRRLGGEMISPPVKTTLELAKEVGYTERTFQHAKQIAKSIVPEVKDLIRGTAIAKSPSALLKIARAGAEERQKAEQSELAGQDAQAKRQAAEARARQKELQMLALQSVAAEKEARGTGRKLQREVTGTTELHASVKSADAVEQIRVRTGDKWLLGRHLVYCGDTTAADFREWLPSNAALAIASPSSPWNHDYLIDEARVVAVMRSAGTIYDFCSRTRMPFRFELVLGGIYIAICSHDPLLKPEHAVNVEGVEEIVAYLISLYTKPGNFVIATSLGHGEVLIACERLGRICFAGDKNSQSVSNAIVRWQRWTGKQAQKD